MTTILKCVSIVYIITELLFTAPKRQSSKVSKDKLLLCHDVQTGWSHCLKGFINNQGTHEHQISSFEDACVEMHLEILKLKFTT